MATKLRNYNVLLKQEAYTRGGLTPMIDLGYGGQFGWATNLKEVISNQAYLARPIIPVVLEVPGFFQFMPNPQKWVETLVNLVENQALTIEGLNATVSVDTDSHQVGAAGEVQEEFTKTNRAKSEPQFTWVERVGAPIRSFLTNWIQYGMADPETGYALVGTLENAPEDMLMDMYSMTVLFIEPDPMHRNVVQSWLCTNMWPKGAGDAIGKFNKTEAREILKHNIAFTALTQHTLGTNVLAQRVLDDIVMKNANPRLRAAFIDGMSANVAAVKATKGYVAGLEDVGKESIVAGRM